MSFLLDRVYDGINTCKNEYEKDLETDAGKVLKDYSMARYCVQESGTDVVKKSITVAQGAYHDCITNHVMPQFQDDSEVFDQDFLHPTKEGRTTYDIVRTLQEEGIFNQSQSTCNGNFSSWYYLTLLISHIYFLVDYILRLIS